MPQCSQVFSGYNNGSFFTGLWGDLRIRHWELSGQAQHRVRTCGSWRLVHRGRVVTCTGPDTQRARSQMCRCELRSPHNLISLYTNSLLPGSVHTVPVTPSPRAQGAQGFQDQAHPDGALGLAEGDSGRPGPSLSLLGPELGSEASCDLWACPYKGKGGVLWSRDALGSNPTSTPYVHCGYGQVEAIAALFPICDMGTVAQRSHRVGMSIKKPWQGAHIRWSSRRQLPALPLPPGLGQFPSSPQRS